MYVDNQDSFIIDIAIVNNVSHYLRSIPLSHTLAFRSSCFIEVTNLLDNFLSIGRYTNDINQHFVRMLSSEASPRTDEARLGFGLPGIFSDT